MAKRQVMGLEEVAAEVGRLFGTTERHARQWMSQRQQLVTTLATLRDKASGLITQLGGTDGGTIKLPGRRRRRKNTASEGTPVIQPGMRESRKKRVISAQTRAKMRAAAKARWAKRKGSKK